jgi:hypothetical protein
MLTQPHANPLVSALSSLDQRDLHVCRMLRLVQTAGVVV